MRVKVEEIHDILLASEVKHPASRDVEKCLE